MNHVALKATSFQINRVVGMIIRQCVAVAPDSYGQSAPHSSALSTSHLQGRTLVLPRDDRASEAEYDLIHIVCVMLRVCEYATQIRLEHLNAIDGNGHGSNFLF